MIECYFKWCKNHDKEEPFCSGTDCTASKVELLYFSELRRKELGLPPKDGVLYDL